MRSQGLYLHGTCRQEVLLDALRGRQGHDDADVRLRASGCDDRSLSCTDRQRCAAKTESLGSQLRLTLCALRLSGALHFSVSSRGP